MALAYGVAEGEKLDCAQQLALDIWEEVRRVDREATEADRVLCRQRNGTFKLNHRWVRVRPVDVNHLYACLTCRRPSAVSFADVCSNGKCDGQLGVANPAAIKDNHYRRLYTIEDFPIQYSAEEHTAQIEADVARDRQSEFEQGNIHLLSSSTTFEVGVDLGELDVVFLRNVPPESFNYTQRVGRAGRRHNRVGLAVTYCRRNPHDLYHFDDPKNRIIQGTVRPPRFKVRNEKIIVRHMMAVALSAFFRSAEGSERFKDVRNFLVNLEAPQATTDVRIFCESNDWIQQMLMHILPDDEVQQLVGLTDGSWIDRIVGSDSHLAIAEAETGHEYGILGDMRDELTERDNAGELQRQEATQLTRVRRRLDTIRKENVLTFLSRRNVIPKYGFPVDVVELDTRPALLHQRAGVTLQRDLSQAIAEYAPGSKIVANKLQWESSAIKLIPGKELQRMHYSINDQRNFSQWEIDQGSPRDKRYIEPSYGFVVPAKAPPRPVRREARLYTTRPFFDRFVDDAPQESTLFGIRLTKALPGRLVILCEGKEGQGFYLCTTCGAHFVDAPQGEHVKPYGGKCGGTVARYSYGHQLLTDVLRMQFPNTTNQNDAYSLGYAVMLGTAEVLNVPDSDLNVTVSCADGDIGFVLYDNVPGGAELVAQLEESATLRCVLEESVHRVEGGCGCTSSCYGCLRSYRNQFMHPHLDRMIALAHLRRALGVA